MFRYKKIIVFFVFVISGMVTFSLSAIGTKKVHRKNTQTLIWSVEKIKGWYAGQPWLSGCNYQPATAINQIEMWSAETFEAATIDKELGWAEELGFNTMRVF